MSFDLSSWLWWRLLSVVMAVVMWLLLAFGVGAVPLSARRAPWAPRVEAAGRFLASEPREGRLNWTARRFELWAGP